MFYLNEQELTLFSK